MLRIGLLGASGIAPAAIIHPAERRTDVTVMAVASRRPSAAADYASVHKIERFYDDYRALLADPDIDLVYNALPPSEHAEWSIAALEAGKDVLCEKPFAMNAAQAERMLESAQATGHRLIEAFHDRYHPLSLEIDALIASGRLGDIVALRADFSVGNPFEPRGIRHVPALGGGALMDLGCYPLHWVRSLMNEEPAIVSAIATTNPLGADMSIEAELRFPSGTTAHVSASMEAGPNETSTLDIVGSRGTAHVDNLVFPSAGHSISETVDGITRVSTVAGLTTYDHQLDAIVTALAQHTPMPTEGADSVNNMIVIDAIYAAAGINRQFN
ncbi:Gfo/Idh/MocA family protein [Cryobacterium serini]|uniref:Gfo/Idh/MocA family oxidoreductase n=1 Tax=Cryobacterium serini TaxID=1259201 RepID=A0A4V3IXD0_9MICO|nr:Gfo/Idh/MocA family oxidoreductase [Cryobacterium serini]TFD90022.1 Gfo/Idh/MocA family oxidoreductase [Cryobacterium serini]